MPAFTDDFSTYANGALETVSGGVWTLMGTTAQVNRVSSPAVGVNIANSFGTTFGACYCPVNSVDHYAQAVKYDANGYASPIVVCRLVDQNNWVGAYYDGSGSWGIYTNVAGTITRVAQAAQFLSVGGQTVRLSVSGATATLTATGLATPVTYGSLSGSLLTATRCGFANASAGQNILPTFQADAITSGGAGLFRVANPLDGLGSGGQFFKNPLG